jgi:8-oxo-dGTP diphosphatase
MKLVTAAIIRDGEDILVVRRGAGEMLAGFWEFPGGPVEHPETLQECLERELFAVLDVATKAGPVIAVCDHEYESGSIKLVAMETEIVLGKITLAVHDKMRWLPAGDILGLKLAPAAIPIAQSLLEESA